MVFWLGIPNWNFQFNGRYVKFIVWSSQCELAGPLIVVSRFLFWKAEKSHAHPTLLKLQLLNLKWPTSNQSVYLIDSVYRVYSMDSVHLFAVCSFQVPFRYREPIDLVIADQAASCANFLSRNLELGCEFGAQNEQLGCLTTECSIAECLIPASLMSRTH